VSGAYRESAEPVEAAEPPGMGDAADAVGTAGAPPTPPAWDDRAC
jgi:hypothetical protein